MQKPMLLHSIVEHRPDLVPKKVKEVTLVSEQQEKIAAASTPSRRVMLEAERERVVELYKCVD